MTPRIPADSARDARGRGRSHPARGRGRVRTHGAVVLRRQGLHRGGSWRPKAFWLRIPFPVLHVDTGHNFREVLEFRDRRVRELGVQLLVASVQDAIDRGMVSEEPNGSRNRIQTPVLLEAVEKYRFTALFGGAAGTRRRRGRRSASTPSATSSASGTRRTSARAVEPLQRPHPPRREHPGLSTVELDRARRLATSPGRHRGSFDLLRART